MARKTQITKEVILKTALQMLLHDGYASINVKTLAAEIGCSTQPIVWHFESMAGFRAAFYAYCIEFAQTQFNPWNGSLDAFFAEIARGYLTIAHNMPQLFRFVFADSGGDYKKSSVVRQMEQGSYEKILHLLRREKGLTEAGAEAFVLNYEFLIHGMASYVAGGLCDLPLEQLLDRATRGREALLGYEQETEGRG